MSIDSSKIPQSPADKKKSQVKEYKDLTAVFLSVGNIGFTMVITILIFFLIGFWLDKLFQKDYLFLIIFLIIGVITGFYQCYRLLKKELKL